MFSVKKSKKEMRKLFGFAFVRITNKDQIVVQDGQHDLCVYKVRTEMLAWFFLYFLNTNKNPDGG